MSKNEKDCWKAGSCFCSCDGCDSGIFITRHGNPACGGHDSECHIGCKK